jgi:hypothetical protein
VIPWPQGGGDGKQPLERSSDGSAKAGRAALTISRASILCESGNRFAWAHGEVERLQKTGLALWCDLEKGIEREIAPCWAASIVVAGTASGPGGAELETQRALDRGRHLAQILKQKFLQRCEDAANVRFFVLNLGLYAEGALSGDAVVQREADVLVGGGETTNSEEVAAAVEAFAASEARFAQYSTCDLYSLDPGGALSLVRSLKFCLRTTRR